MTDEKDPKEIAGAPEEAAEPADASGEAKPADPPAATESAGAPELKETEAIAAKTEVEAEAPHAAKPTEAHGLTELSVLAPAPGVRVRVAYANGSSVDIPSEPKGRLKARRLLAEYDTTAEVIHAAESLRDAGYKSFEAHSPFPIHGMDAAMGLSDSKLGWIVLLCGLTGVSSAWVMMYWMNGVDYPLIIGGKPPGTLPSMVPIMFELTVLLSAFGAVFGMFGLNRLPQHHDVLFYSDRFAAFSNDKFFISVDSTDPKFDVTKTRQLLEKTKPEVIEVIETIEEVTS